MKILFYCWKAYNQSDIIAALRRRGHVVDTFEMELGNFEKDDNFEREFRRRLQGGAAGQTCAAAGRACEAAGQTCADSGQVCDAAGVECGDPGMSENAVDSIVYDAVFSVNYFPIISDICAQLSNSGLKYVCWTCDSPLSTMYHESIFNKCNYIFIFDRFCYMTFKELGANVYYLPLAAATERAEGAVAAWRRSLMPDKDGVGTCAELENASGSGAPGNGMLQEEGMIFQYEVSFVGSMYRKNSYDEIKDMLPDYVRGYFDALMKLQLEIYGENYIDGMLTAEIMDELNRHFRIEKSERSFSNISLIFSTTVLGFKIAQLERYKLLGALSKRFDVSVFTDDENADFVLAHNMGPVRYWDESPVVFYTSRINLNFTIRNIRSGIPLRVWDILAAGGFCITNFQPELVLYFKNGEDLVWFEDEADLVRKVRYYLEHEEERKQIALMGQRKVRELHNYDVRISEIERELGRQLV